MSSVKKKLQWMVESVILNSEVSNGQEGQKAAEPNENVMMI